MSIIFLLAPLSLLLAGVFVFLFFKAVQSGQFSDLETPASRILIDSPANDRKGSENESDS